MILDLVRGCRTRPGGSGVEVLAEDDVRRKFRGYVAELVPVDPARPLSPWRREWARRARTERRGR